MNRALFFITAVMLTTPAWAGRHQITGQVIDRNGNPVEQAIVSLSPGNVQIVTDREGKFLLDYLRDETGNRLKLAKKTDYTFEVFKAGFHVKSTETFYKKGPLAMEPITLVEDSIKVVDDGLELDPSIYSNPTQSSGANYEGQ